MISLNCNMPLKHAVHCFKCLCNAVVFLVWKDLHWLEKLHENNCAVTSTREYPRIYTAYLKLGNQVGNKPPSTSIANHRFPMKTMFL